MNKYPIERRIYNSNGKWIGGHYIAGFLHLTNKQAGIIGDQRIHTCKKYKCLAGPKGQIWAQLNIKRSDLTIEWRDGQ